MSVLLPWALAATTAGAAVEGEEERQTDDKTERRDGTLIAVPATAVVGRARPTAYKTGCQGLGNRSEQQGEHRQ